MAVQLNHTIVWCTDKERSAAFATEILGLPPAVPFGPFMVVELDNDVSIDFHDVGHDGGDDAGHAGPDIAAQHDAFLISEEEFDQVFARVTGRGIEYFADPGCSQRGEINRRDRGRGFYFADPDGHLLEVLTRAYGAG
jgi:catechol 2,3-dioxygenase-like lactoylglutathione lyase family enzyme